MPAFGSLGIRIANSRPAKATESNAISNTTAAIIVHSAEDVKEESKGWGGSLL